MPLFTVACVLKAGGEQNYGPKHVQWLQAQVKRYLTIPYRFVCLSDVDVPGCETISLLHGWPVWWSKLELFRPGLFDGHVLYLDLDVLIVGNLDKLGQGNLSQFAILRNKPHLPEPDDYYPVDSSVMAWSADMSYLYHLFLENPNAQIGKRDNEPKTKQFYSDQEFISEYSRAKLEILQDLYPGYFLTRRFQVERLGHIPKGARVILYHTPKFKPWKCKYAASYYRRLRINVNA